MFVLCRHQEFEANLVEKAPHLLRLQTGARQLREQFSKVSWNGTETDIRVGGQTEPILRGMYYDLRQLRGLTDVGDKA